MNEARVREATPADDDVVLGLMTEYMTWALATFEQTYGFAMGDDPAGGTAGDAPDARHTAAALARFRRPTGVLVLAEVGQDAGTEPVGVAALRVQPDGAAEIKRMFVRPEHQGTGLGAALLDRLLAVACDDLHAPVVRLDSNRFMDRAHRLYASRGFVERTPYPGSEIPQRLQHLWRFYELRPGQGPAGTDHRSLADRAPRA